MKITRIETVVFPDLPRLLHVRVYTDEGLIGSGETYDKVPGSRAAIHGTLAPLLLGNDPRRIEALNAFIFDNVLYHGFQGAEWRGWSAIEIALWDILAKSLNTSVRTLLGGAVHETLPCYNTCIGYGAVRDYPRWYEDAGGLAASLLEDGYTAMKIWPFDRYSEASMGQRLSSKDLRQGLEPVKQIRETVGDQMAIGIEGHSRWNRVNARKIAAALEAHDILFLEDIMPAIQVAEYAALAKETQIPLVGSETLFTRYALREPILQQSFGIIMTDTIWTGGISETLKIASLAQTFGLPVILHNLGGPVAHAAICQVASVIPNLFAVETSRAITTTYFPELGDYVPTIQSGQMSLPEGIGLGAEIADQRWKSAEDRQVSEGAGMAKGLKSMGDHWAKAEIR